MSVIRVKKNKNYTVMSNVHLRDKTLSLKGKGLLSLMLSLPEEWDYSIAGLVTLSDDGATAVRSGLVELEDHKYLTRRSIRENGKIVDWEYTVYETPLEGKPVVEKPVVENPQVEKRTEINTKEPITKELSKDEINKEKNTAARQSDDIEKEFENLWSLYPRKLGKANAFKTYKAVRKGHPEIYKQVEAGIHAYITYLKATNIPKQYIKHGSTWFNQKCWQDDWSDFNAEPSKPDPEGIESGYRFPEL